VAEYDEEIIIIEEEEAAGVVSFEHRYDDKGTKKPSSRKKFLFIGSALALVFVVLLVFLLVDTDGAPRYQEEIAFSPKQTTQDEIKKLSSSDLEQMIKRANHLYEHGYKPDALKLYEKIATYSESISYYNLGVAQFKDKQYEKAIKSFDLAIQNKQNLCVSAINAAVASLALGDQKRFEKYINLAQSYLSQEAASPMYSYYFALISFYQENYLEALSALTHRSSQEYEVLQNQLQAKISTLFGSYHTAISSLEKDYQDENALSLGLLYANLGDLILAKKYLRAAIQQGISPAKSQVALALVDLKAGQVHNAANLLNNITEMYPEEVYTYYPVETFLKESLFNVDLAQQNFHDNIIHNQSTIYQVLFYFAPFKIFNANQMISYIRKGNANVSIDNISSASEYLNQSASLSKVNLNIAKSIQMALNFHLQEANQRLFEMAELYPRHAIVHYNLALTYAQMGELSLAHKHFVQSYHLDAKNYLSGIFAMLCAKVTNQENQKFNQIIKENLALEPKDEEFDFYRALIHFKEANFPATYQWMEHKKKERPLNLAFDALIAMSMGKETLAQQSTQKLITMLPKDILPHLLYIDAHYAKEESKMFARNAITHLKRQKFSMDDFYYGPFITKYLYMQYAQTTGALHPLRQQLKEKMRMEKESPIGIIQALALVSIYTQNFEEAFSLYNELIDTYKQQDSHTLFLAAIAATGAKHPANAIALLELSKRKNPKHKESRYALGLLYLQTQNNEGAVIAFRHISEVDFQSQFFDFKINK
jgi:Flp pilus assembly protein TadD